jgi:histidine phosphotransferase ChpT
MFQDDKISFAWSAPRLLFPKNRVKLLLNLIMIAMTAIPRGGSLVANVSGDADKCDYTIRAKGLNARIPAHAEELLAGKSESGTVDAHGIQVYYAGEVARAAGMSIAFSIDGDEVTIRAATA